MSAQPPNPELDEALVELQQYLSDAVAPLIVADSVQLLMKYPPDVVANAIRAWTGAQYRRGSAAAVPVSDYLFHTLKKIHLMAEFRLVPARAARGVSRGAPSAHPSTVSGRRPGHVDREPRPARRGPGDDLAGAEHLSPGSDRRRPVPGRARPAARRREAPGARCRPVPSRRTPCTASPWCSRGSRLRAVSRNTARRALLGRPPPPHSAESRRSGFPCRWLRVRAKRSPSPRAAPSRPKSSRRTWPASKRWGSRPGPTACSALSRRRSPVG